MDNNKTWTTVSYVSAILIGVILFWLFGKDWLNLESALVFLAGLIGVVVTVLAFGIWNNRRNSHR
jgi:hypothetical protein